MTGLAFKDGRFLPFDEITIGIGTHAFNYGTSVFEGMRAYWDEASERLLMFRPEEHFARLHYSARLFDMRLPHNINELCLITEDLLVRNGVRENVYIRPVLYKSSTGIGLWRADMDDSFVVYQVPLGEYHAGSGIRCCVSSWRRAEGNAAPARAKVGGVYAAMALARHEAVSLGFDEAITLTANGHVAEGTAENIFLVIGDSVVTPGLGEDLLAGITRASIIELMRAELGLDVVERAVNRSELYFADEVFMCGTAAEVTPVLEIDRRVIGDGTIGATAKAVRDLYLEVVHGRRPSYCRWSRPVSLGVEAT